MFEHHTVRKAFPCGTLDSGVANPPNTSAWARGKGESYHCRDSSHVNIVCIWLAKTLTALFHLNILYSSMFHFLYAVSNCNYGYAPPVELWSHNTGSTPRRLDHIIGSVPCI
jgi:hypothetical protein